MTRTIDPAAIDRLKLSSPPQYDREDPKVNALANLRELNHYCGTSVTLEEFRTADLGEKYFERMHIPDRIFMGLSMTDKQTANIGAAMDIAGGEPEEALDTICREWQEMRVQKQQLQQGVTSFNPADIEAYIERCRAAGIAGPQHAEMLRLVGASRSES